MLQVSHAHFPPANEKFRVKLCWIVCMISTAQICWRGVVDLNWVGTLLIRLLICGLQGSSEPNGMLCNFTLHAADWP
jgi:hypothetical protein